MYNETHPSHTRSPKRTSYSITSKLALIAIIYYYESETCVCIHTLLDDDIFEPENNYL